MVESPILYAVIWISHESPDLFRGNLHNSPHLVQPQPVINCFNDSGDRTELLACRNCHSPEASLAEKHQPEFTAHPDVLPKAANDLNSTHIETIVLRVRADLFSIKYIHLARVETEPNSSGRVMITGARSANWNSFG